MEPNKSMMVKKLHSIKPDKHSNKLSQNGNKVMMRELLNSKMSSEGWSMKQRQMSKIRRKKRQDFLSN